MEGVSTTPPAEDAFLWFREDIVKLFLQRALEDAIETHGSAAKAFAWDVNARLKELLRNA